MSRYPGLSCVLPIMKPDDGRWFFLAGSSCGRACRAVVGFGGPYHRPMRLLLVGGCALLGVLVGSATPLPVYRLAVPAGSAPRSACGDCRDMFPAGWRGWFSTGGRCPGCGTALSRRRWVYVVMVAAGFAALAWRLPPDGPAQLLLLAAWLLVTAVGTVLAGIDLWVQRLPGCILAPTAGAVLTLVGVAALVAGDAGPLGRALAGAAVFGLAYLVLGLIGGGLVGLGDVYLAGLLGLLLGTGSAATVLAGALAPYLIGAPVTAARLATGALDRGSRIAWGPYLVTGAVLATVVFPGRA